MTQVSLQLRFRVLERDKYTCQICGKKPPEVRVEIDHIIPVAEGGTNNLDNLRTTCFECNRGRGTLVPKSKSANHSNIKRIPKPDENVSTVHPQTVLEGTNYFPVEHGYDNYEQVVDLSEIIAFEAYYRWLFDSAYEWQVKLYFRQQPRSITLHLTHYGYDMFLLAFAKSAKYKKE